MDERLDDSRRRRLRQLLAAAEAAFAEQGFHRTSVKDITDRAGVAAGTFYLYFPSKEASCLAVIDDVYRELIETVVRRRAGCDGVLPKLAASVAAAVETFALRPSAARLVLVQAPGAHPEFDRRLNEIHAELSQLVARDVAEAVAAGALPEQEPEVAARCLVGSLYEVLIAWVREGALADPRQALPGLLTFVLRGLGAEAPAMAAARQAALAAVGWRD